MTLDGATDSRLEVYHHIASGVHGTWTVPKGADYEEDMLSLTRENIAGMGRHDIGRSRWSRSTTMLPDVCDKLLSLKLSEFGRGRFSEVLTLSNLLAEPTRASPIYHRSVERSWNFNRRS